MTAFVFKPSNALIGQFDVRSIYFVEEGFAEFAAKNTVEAWDYVECSGSTWTVQGDGTKLALTQGRLVPKGRSGNSVQIRPRVQQGVSSAAMATAAQIELPQNTSATPIALNLPSFLASIGMCAGFFMPWVSILGLGLSGSTLGKIGDEGQLAWIIFILALVNAITHFACPSKVLNVITGVVPFVMLMYFTSKMGDELFNVLAVGAWVTLGCGLILIFAPVKELYEHG